MVLVVYPIVADESQFDKNGNPVTDMFVDEEVEGIINWVLKKTKLPTFTYLAVV